MKYFIVDAFTDELFKGNQAGVCFLDSWLDDDLMQRIAVENNFSETAFLVKRVDSSGSNRADNSAYDLRWFTPEAEIDLCGHATLASAFVITQLMYTDVLEVEFHTMSGILTVKKKGDLFEMDFPAREPQPIPITPCMEQAIGAPVLEAHLSRDMMLLLDCEQTVQELNPDPGLVAQLPDCFALIVTSKGDQVDFVSRVFAPNSGIFEDPVTGSTHSTLIPFWAQRLQKSKMIARQLSKRGGTIQCEDCGDRVKISGQAVLYLQGEILLDG